MEREFFNACALRPSSWPLPSVHAIACGSRDVPTAKWMWVRGPPRCPGVAPVFLGAQQARLPAEVKSFWVKLPGTRSEGPGPSGGWVTTGPEAPPGGLVRVPEAAPDVTEKVGAAGRWRHCCLGTQVGRRSPAPLGREHCPREPPSPASGHSVGTTGPGSHCSPPHRLLEAPQAFSIARVPGWLSIGHNPWGPCPRPGSCRVQ